MFLLLLLQDDQKQMSLANGRSVCRAVPTNATQLCLPVASMDFLYNLPLSN